MKGDSGSKGEKARSYYDANRKRFYFVFLISANVPYQEPCANVASVFGSVLSQREGEKPL